MSIAKDLLLPKEKGILRVAFLYVGQGEATIATIPDGQNYRFMLIDTNLSKDLGGINIPKLISDLTDKKLDYFVNTHPHKDHLSGLKEIIDEGIEIANVWHTGQSPNEDSKEEHEILEELISSLGDDNTFEIRGSNDQVEIGDVKINLFAPADYVKEEIDDETEEQQDARIHEYCAVFGFCYGIDEKQVLITGDAYLKAWKEHITDYHKERLPSQILSAIHHGSRSFFVEKKGDDPYLDHLDAINPEYVAISAPTSDESPHDHPHEDAVGQYENKCGAENVYHLGDMRTCFIVDIDSKGNITPPTEDNKLVEEYGFDNEKEENSSKSELVVISAPEKLWSPSS